jgi:hypothetical protein
LSTAINPIHICFCSIAINDIAINHVIYIYNNYIYINAPYCGYTDILYPVQSCAYQPQMNPPWTSSSDLL